MPALPFIPWPRTLLWRTFVLIVLLLGASLLAWLQIYQQYALKPRSEQISQMVVSVVNITRAALIAADASQRLALLRELRAEEGIRILPAEQDDITGELPSTEPMLLLEQRVRQRLGDFTRFAAQLNGKEGFFVSFRVDERDPEDEYWLMLPPERVARNTAVQWLGWGAVAILTSLLGAYLLVLGVTRPLKALERAASAIGRGEPPGVLPQQGAREIVAVAQAFEQMHHDLAQLDSDRALILAGVSHDLRTPLARLRLGIEMSGASAADIDAMGSDIEEMDRIIRQFLDFARDAQQEACVSTELVALLAQLVERYQRRGAHLTLHAPPDCTLAIRAESIRRAVTNLIENALRYAGQDLPIDIFLRRTGQCVDIEVADRGPGIPPEEVDRIKRPFTRLEAARTDARGSGLGLAIVERIARQHEGNLRLLARPDGGLRAILQLPAVE